MDGLGHTNQVSPPPSTWRRALVGWIDPGEPHPYRGPFARWPRAADLVLALAVLAGSLVAVTVSALGDSTYRDDNKLISKEKIKHLPGAVKPTLPVIRDGPELVAIPHLGLHDTSLGPESLDLRFCPHTPLANAPFMPHITR